MQHQATRKSVPRRLAALLTALVLLLGMAPFSVWAAGETTTTFIYTGDQEWDVLVWTNLGFESDDETAVYPGCGNTGWTAEGTATDYGLTVRSATESTTYKLEITTSDTTPAGAKLTGMWSTSGGHVDLNNVNCPLDGSTYVISDATTVTKQETGGEETTPDPKSATFTLVSDYTLPNNGFQFVVGSDWIGHSETKQGISVSLDTTAKMATVSWDGNTAATITGQPYIYTSNGEINKTYDSVTLSGGETYYLTADGCSTTEPDPTPTVTTKHTYNMTVHVKSDESLYLGGWMILVEDGSETGWSPNGDGMTADFLASNKDADGWITATATKEYTDAKEDTSFNRFAFQTGGSADSRYESGKYYFDFTGTSGEFWFIPGDGLYATESEATAALNKVDYTLEITRPGTGWTATGKLEDSNGNWTGEASATAVQQVTRSRAAEDVWGTATLTWKVNPNTTLKTVGVTVTPAADETAKNPVYYEHPLNVTVSTGTEKTEVFLADNDSPTVYTTKAEAAAAASAETRNYKVTVHYRGTAGTAVQGWVTDTPDYKLMSAKVVATLSDPDEKGWASATFNWTLPKSGYNQVGFYVGGTSYTYNVSGESDVELDLWAITWKFTPAVFTSLESLESAIAWEQWELEQRRGDNNYSFRVHYLGKNAYFGGWLAKVEGGKEVDWSHKDDSVHGLLSSSKNSPWSSKIFTFYRMKEYNRLSFQISEKALWEGPIRTFDFDGSLMDLWLIPDDTAVYATKAAAEAAYNLRNSDHTLTIHCPAKDYLLNGSLSQASGGSDEAEQVSANFLHYQNGWGAAILYRPKEDFDRLTFRVAADEAGLADSQKYQYDFRGLSGEVWVVPGDPELYFSRSAAEAAMAGNRVPDYNFTLHYKSAAGYAGAWMTRTEDGADGETITVPLANFDGTWASAGLSWDVDGIYDRLSFQVGPDPVSLWNNLKYVHSFSTGGDIWVIPGDATVYTSNPLKGIAQSGLPGKEPAALPEDASGAVVHSVVRGDTLWALSRKYGSTPARIVAANKERYPKMTADYIVTGWTLIIP